MNEEDNALARVEAWAWERHGMMEHLANMHPDPLSRSKWINKAEAYMEMGWYIKGVRDARDSRVEAK